MLYSTLFNLLAGVVTGLAFKVQVLLVLLALVLIEAVFLAFINGPTGVLWGLANFAGTQLGYLVGSFTRSVIEETRSSGVRARRIP